MNNINIMRYSYEKQARALANNTGLRLVWEEEHRPRTDGINLYIGRPDPTWDKDMYTKWMHSIYHEIGHNVPEMRDCFDIVKEKNINMKSFLGICLNLTDDYRQEHHEHDKYLGKKECVDRSTYLWNKEYITAPDSVYNNEPQDKKMSVLRTWKAWDVLLREDWQRSCIGQSKQLYDLLSSTEQAWYDKLVAGDYADVINNNPTAEDEYKLVKRIIDEVFEMDSEEEERAAQESSSSSDSDENGDESEDGQGKSKSSSSEGDEGEGARRELEASVRYDDILMHKHGADNPGASYAPLHIDYTNYTARTFSPRSEEEMTIVNYKDEAVTITRYGQQISNTMSSSALSKQVRKLLQTLSVSTHIHGQKRGKISNKNIHRATHRGNSEYNKRIFKKKVDNTVLDSAVTVLVDGSGSMGGDKFIHAAQSAIMLNDSIAKIGVPVEIIGFSEYSGPIHAVYKGFNESVSADDLAMRFGNFGNRYMANNSDGEAILWSVGRLLKRKEKKKVLIVLSDGSPASGWGDAMTFTIDLVKQLESRRDLDVYGVGIQDDNVKYIYKNNTVINNSNEIDSAIFNIIKQRIVNL